MCAGAPYAEPAYGYPEASQTVVNVTNGKLIRLLVDDEPLDVRYGRLLEHERVLDLRAGTMTRHAESLPSPASGLPWWPASAACASTGGSCRSHRGFRIASAG